MRIFGYPHGSITVSACAWGDFRLSKTQLAAKLRCRDVLLFGRVKQRAMRLLLPLDTLIPAGPEPSKATPYLLPPAGLRLKRGFDHANHSPPPLPTKSLRKKISDANRPEPLENYNASNWWGGRVAPLRLRGGGV